MEMMIFRAALEDAEELLALQKIAYQTEARLYDDWSIPPLTQTIEALRAEFDAFVVLKAVEDGRIVGSVRARLDGTVCAIGRLFVHPDARRRGIGTALLQAIEQAFPAAERYALFTGDRSADNLRLYARQGYVPTRAETVSPTLTMRHLEKTGRAAAAE